LIFKLYFFIVLHWGAFNIKPLVGVVPCDALLGRYVFR